MNTALHFSSQTDLHATPQDFFDKLDAEFHFTVDVCANATNRKCADYYDRKRDGLVQAWAGTCWMNPPYGDPEFPCRPTCYKKRCARRGYCVSQYVPGIKD